MRISTPKTLLAIGIVLFVAAAGDIGYRFGNANHFSTGFGSAINGDLAVDQLASITWSARPVEDGEVHPHFWQRLPLDFRAPHGMVRGTAPTEPVALIDALWPLSRQVMKESGSDQHHDIPFVIAIAK